ncbi:hypothetical protein E2C01_044767 [Portunus trituberculatus]|uniref:Uncharacterized protein n=1 Tax=Portunus trituberculatus TaxID=210409 RepID=A0A5B7G126_PORTR|nr:hypothetical protein [Portunus trituberculatus]
MCLLQEVAPFGTFLPVHCGHKVDL